MRRLTEDRMLTVPIAVINASTLVSRQEALAATAAIQMQVHRDFAPVWNVDADLALLVPGERPPTGAWWLIILDNSDLGSALGYHDLTTNGQPLAKVFAGTAKQAGQAWTTLFSHEVLEMLADPYINLTAFAPTPSGNLLYAYENCDACQSDRYGYMIDDQLVSDFVYPSWFNPAPAASAQFDFGRQIARPFQLLAGGYTMVFDLTFGTGWHLVIAPGTPPAYNMRPRVGSRRERRRTTYVNWQKSVVATGSDFRSARTERPRR
jgi:hypothetical protein